MLFRTLTHPSLLLTALLAAFGVASAQDVVVSSGDLGIGRTFTASSTCGLVGPQTYCVLNPENGDRQCFTCDASEPAQSHPTTFLTDADSGAMSDRTWWQAENGLHNVTLELKLEALFSFSHLVITFCSPRPAAAVVERSRDFGATYQPYQFYSNNCEEDFGMPARSGVRTVDEVICTSEYSSIEPLTNGELIYRAVPPTLGIRDYNTPSIIDKITLTNLRIRFLRLNTLPGDDLSDPSAATSYQYAVYSIVVRGRCFCNGHSPMCDPPSDVTHIEPGMVNSDCRCTGHTMGEKCEQCQPLYNDRPWSPALGPGQGTNTNRDCRECRCYGRASSCHFDPQVAVETGGSGGVCDNCTHHTTGRMCQRCMVGFYRNTSTLLSDPNMCIPCQCHHAGSVSSVCYPDDDPSDLRIVSGSCECRANVEGKLCDRCKPGFFNRSDDNPAGCQPCECDMMGSEFTECHMTTGECTCKSHVIGHSCNMCEYGYWSMGTGGCRACDCHPGGSLSPYCHPDNGSCECRSGVIGQRCDTVAPGQFVVTGLTLNEMRKLPINGEFSIWLRIHPDDYRNVAVLNFDMTYAASDIDLPFPKPPLCTGSDSHVTSGTIPFYNVPLVRDVESGQYYIQVIPALCWSKDRVSVPYQLVINGIVQSPHDVIVSLMPSYMTMLRSLQQAETGGEEEAGEEEEEEEESVSEDCFPIPPQSDVSEECRDVALSVTASQTDGTLVCACDPVGSLSATCDEINGQCSCAPGVDSRTCDTCSPGYFGLTVGGCTPCNCNLDGSPTAICDPVTGQCGCTEGSGDQCQCREGFNGLRCDRCATDHFFSSATSECIPCDCNEQGSSSSECDEDGKCMCLLGVRGLKCDECRPDHFNFSSTGCTPCGCYAMGSIRDDGVCDSETGECDCVEGVMGRRCDECPGQSVGPNRNTITPCTDCFCNGHSRRCSSAEGWYQARVESGFDSGGVMEGFRSNGDIFRNQGCLEFDPSRPSLSISLPKAFRGDKRTSYNQILTFNLSIPHIYPSDSYHVFVEVVGRLNRYRQTTLVAELPLPGNQPQLIEFPLAPGPGVQVDLWFWKRLASQRDIRQILADIRAVRLKVVFGQSTTPVTVILCGVSLGYATNEASDPFALVPLKPVKYVERCDCPPNREGPLCENCSPGYTTDPSLGGEFAHCVRCFCNYHSSSCDPNTGECFNCSDNTEGPDCERCISGYFRNTTLRTDGCIPCECSVSGTVGGACRATEGVCDCREGFTGARCDECSEQYWSPSPGQCVACDCDVNGSLSLACNQTTGTCLCLPNVVGEKCDRCRQNSTDFFPSCEACDECTGAWQTRINPLRTDVEATLELIRVTTVTTDPEDVPLVSVLLNLLAEVREILDASRIDPELAGNVTELHRRLCELANQTRDLFSRAVAVSDEIAMLESGVDVFRDEASRLAMLLGELRNELERLTVEFESISILDIDPNVYLALARQAEERSTDADQLITINTTNLISLTEGILAEYNRQLAESNFPARQMENLRLLSDLSQRVSEYELFLIEANSKLCGSRANSSNVCDECGGIRCDGCGENPGCNSLVNMASESLNVSREALGIARGLRNETLSQVVQLRILLSDIVALRNETLDARSAAQDVRQRAGNLSDEVKGLLEILQRRLVDERVDPNVIEEVENEALSLQLSVNQEEFLGILVAINETIDEIFGRFGVNSTNLLRRAEDALNRAQNANSLAAVLASNVTALETRLQRLQENEEEIRDALELSQRNNENTTILLSEIGASLNETSIRLDTTADSLADLSLSLDQLEAMITDNRAALTNASEVTRQAEIASTAVNQSSLDLETNYVLLRNATEEKIRMSREQLRTAQNYRDRTAALIERTSQQLLLEENLERAEAALLLEQEVIRGDVQRLSLQLEELSELIQVHIARNTACLDAGSLQKR